MATATAKRMSAKTTKKTERNEAREAKKAELSAAAETFELDEDDDRIMRVYHSLLARYSAGNALLIIMQEIQLGLTITDQVGGYDHMLSIGRQVRKGQHKDQLYIWAPIMKGRKVVEDDEDGPFTTDAERKKVGYTVIGIFHLDQTDPKEEPYAGELPLAGNPYPLT